MSVSEALDWEEQTFIFRFDALEMKPQRSFCSVDDVAVHLEEAASLVAGGLAQDGFLPKNVSFSARMTAEGQPRSTVIQIEAVHALTVNDASIQALASKAHDLICYFLSGKPGTILSSCSR
ncbi:MAG TPA: hypothetical protein VI913_02110 [Candidatus Peribacteraceae bacterium]|nr:hypothetical protein [Candidatus Peribacteraceae bacterium]